MLKITPMNPEQIQLLDTRLLAFARKRKVTPEDALRFLVDYGLNRLDALARHKAVQNEKRSKARREQLAPCAGCKQQYQRAELALYRGRETLCAPCLMTRTGAMPLPLPVVHGPEPVFVQPHEEPDASEPHPEPPDIDSPWLDRAKRELSAEGLTRGEADGRFKVLLEKASPEETQALTVFYQKHRVTLPSAEGAREEVARVGRRRTEQTKKRVKEKVVLGKGKKKK